jgi:hypothetical protein
MVFTACKTRGVPGGVRKFYNMNIGFRQTVSAVFRAPSGKAKGFTQHPGALQNS